MLFSMTQFLWAIFSIWKSSYMVVSPARRDPKVTCLWLFIKSETYDFRTKLLRVKKTQHSSGNSYLWPFTDFFIWTQDELRARSAPWCHVIWKALSLLSQSASSKMKGPRGEPACRGVPWGSCRTFSRQQGFWRSWVLKCLFPLIFGVNFNP